MDKAFKQFVVSGTRYLAIPRNPGSRSNTVLILDENGSNFGGWSCVESFVDACKGRKDAITGSVLEPTVLGKVTLVARCVEES